MRPIFFAVLAVTSLFCADNALACDRTDIGPEVFCGIYRAGPKTSFYKVSGQLAQFQKFVDVKELLQSLPKDSSMRDRYNWGLHVAPTVRVTEERMNVEITTGYIVAVKPGEDDRDFHVIVSDSPNHSGATFMNVEVSGLPQDGVDNDDFARARDEIRSVLPDGSDHGTSYILLHEPVKVTVKGSVYFDGDHRAGCKTCPGPASAKPRTVWEIHPVYSFEKIQ
jgi:hypothetical protein